ncbi:conserved hypothetical protein [Methylocella tundrae]|uniref:Uncharacterized protein n=1 Tax=Methylocella tundrae TaxID=227605 RepID=A0A8B6M427_METTU|nr:hypothetical protein [Methylocella tundrae]VTZ26067.1 conserved hypothetical protein [Methylocella tundrae]VTZ49123.1 conserved hypothetical protein [Methylocella tundrae]
MIAEVLRAAEGGDAPVQLRGVGVRTDAEKIAAFRRESGDAVGQTAGENFDPNAVPLTYPFCWLTMPEIRPTLEGRIGAGFLPVHEAQSFDYDRPLAVGRDYLLDFTFTRTSDPERLTVKVAISTPDAGTWATFETVLRIVPLAAIAAPSNE